ncbi:UNVERIFIED_CONTAM: putative mitochondrial protein, partial [Sesamum indicum]
MAWAWLVLALFWRRESGKGTPAGRLSGGLRCCVRPMPICIVCAECLPVRNGKPSGASFDCDLLKHGQHKPRPSKGWSVGPLMLVGLPRISGPTWVPSDSTPVACEHGGVKGGRRRLAPPPVGSRWHPHGRVLEGGLALGPAGARRPPAAPKPRPSSWLGRGLCWPCFGSESPARDSGGALERGSTGVACGRCPFASCAPNAFPSATGKPSGACFDCDLLKHGPTQAPSKPKVGRSVRLCLSASPRISGPMGCRRDSTVGGACRRLWLATLKLVACGGRSVGNPDFGLRLLVARCLRTWRRQGRPATACTPDRRLPGGTHTGRVWSSSSSVARDPEISSTWLAKCRQSRHARLPHGSWGMLLGALASSPSPAKVEASQQASRDNIPRKPLQSSAQARSCLGRGRFPVLHTYREGIPLSPNVPFSPCAAPLGAAARGGPQGARCVPRPAHGRTCPGRWPIASSPDLSDAEHTVGYEGLGLCLPRKQAFGASCERRPPPFWARPMRAAESVRNATWLILPVVICLSQRLSHACVIILELIRATNPDFWKGMHLLDKRSTRAPPVAAMIHDNSTDRTALVPATHHSNFCPINFRWVRFRRGSLRNGYHIQGRQQARKLPNPDTGRLVTINNNTGLYESGSIGGQVWCQQLFRGIAMPKSFTATTISLIPKTASPVSWSEYRPISLCNVTNKICTKLMSIRLGHVLPKVLSPSQSGFVPGRLLSDNVLLAQELVHSLESRRSEANVIFKLDMAKAYDRVNWEFLFQVLRLKGFPQHWINLVANAVSNCWFSVLVNGEHAGFFHSTRGLRQGDPLSPALFVLAADYLSQGLNRLFVAHPTMYYQSPGRVRVSHLAYADDMMIFTNICRQHMELLRTIVTIARGTIRYGLPAKISPSHIFGCPFIQGIRDMLQGWAMTNLSHGGRLALIRSVLQAMPLHLLQVIHPPKSVLITIERIFNGFFWGSYNGRRHIHWCSWDKICRPVAERWFGLKSSLWSEYLHDRYCRALHPTHVPYNRNHSSVWHRLCRIRDVAEPLIFWTLGQGAKPLAQLVRGAPDTMEPVCYYWHEGEWNVPKIFRIVPATDRAYYLAEFLLQRDRGTELCGPRRSNGTFSTASAWEAIRVASPRRQLFTDIWHRSLRPTDWIPVDERMKRKGFSFASKCQCCEAEESISHLFVEGEVVRELCETRDLVNLVHFWRYSTPVSTLDLHIRTLVPFLILWSTWTQRNAAKYHGAHFTATGTILEVQRHLRTLYAARIMTSIQWKGDLHRALAMGFCFRPIVPQAPRVVRWSTPSPAWFKLNSDGSSLGNPGPGSSGRHYSGCRWTELARAHSLAPIVVEVDATVVLQLLQSRASGIWEMQHLIMRIVQLQQELGSDVRHIFREANGAADHLAKDAASRQLTRVMYQEDITGVLRGIIRLDKMGTPIPSPVSLRSGIGERL